MTVQEYFKKEWLKRKILTLFVKKGRYSLSHFEAVAGIMFRENYERIDVAIEELVLERKISIKREQECFGYQNWVYRI